MMVSGGDVESLEGASGSEKAATKKKKKRVKGIEPSPKAWEAFILPLNYTRDLCRQRTNWPRKGQAGSPVIDPTGMNQA